MPYNAGIILCKILNGHYVKKPECPVLYTGMNGKLYFLLNLNAALLFVAFRHVFLFEFLSFSCSGSVDCLRIYTPAAFIQVIDPNN